MHLNTEPGIISGVYNVVLRFEVCLIECAVMQAQVQATFLLLSNISASVSAHKPLTKQCI